MEIVQNIEKCETEPHNKPEFSHYRLKITFWKSYFRQLC